MRRPAVVCLFFLLLGIGPLAHADPKPAKPRKARHGADIADTINSNVIYSKFARLVAAADMGTFLSSRGPFTIFIPTNSAFSKLPAGMYDDLLLPINKTQTQRLVLFHLINGKAWHTMDLQAQKSLLSCEGAALPLKATKVGTIFVDKAKVMRADQHCENGIIDEIDSVLAPKDLMLIPTTPPDNPGTIGAAPASTSTSAGMTTNAAPAEVTDPSETNDAPLKNLPSAPPPTPSPGSIQ